MFPAFFRVLETYRSLIESSWAQMMHSAVLTVRYSGSVLLGCSSKQKSDARLHDYSGELLQQLLGQTVRVSDCCELSSMTSRAAGSTSTAGRS